MVWPDRKQNLKGKNRSRTPARMYRRLKPYPKNNPATAANKKPPKPRLDLNAAGISLKKEKGYHDFLVYTHPYPNWFENVPEIP